MRAFGWFVTLAVVAFTAADMGNAILNAAAIVPLCAGWYHYGHAKGVNQTLEMLRGTP